MRHEALRAAWLAASARWQRDSVVDFELDAFLESDLAADRLPMLADLVAESRSFAIAVWAGGSRGPLLLEALLQEPEATLDGVKTALAQARPNQAVGFVELLRHVPGNSGLQLLADLARRSPPRVRAAASAALETARATAPAPLEVSGLGALRIVRRGAVIPERAWHRQRALELLGLLLVAGPAGRTRDELIDQCWPEALPEAGIEQFHTHLHALRVALKPEAARGASRYVVVDGRVYRLDFDLIQRWDVADLTLQVALGQAAAARGELDEAESAYATASDLYRGPLFDGLPIESASLLAAREYYQQLALEARVGLARVLEERGDPLGARQAWTSVLALDPLREDAHRAVMAILRGLGQRDAALAHYRSMVGVLRRELGVEPSPETVTLYSQILAA